MKLLSVQSITNFTLFAMSQAKASGADENYIIESRFIMCILGPLRAHCPLLELGSGIYGIMLSDKRILK